MSFGGLMMAVGAFTQVQSSLRWFVDNIGGIADWRATLLRVAAFRSAMLKVDELARCREAHRLRRGRRPASMTFDESGDRLAGGLHACWTSASRDRAGEHVLVTGDPGAGKTLLFRALAGLWPWGGGRIGLPKGEAVFFMPRTPYLPPGTLREVLAYPLGTSRTSPTRDSLAAL